MLTLVAGCGGDSKPSPQVSSSSSEAQTAATTAPAPNTRDTSQKPVIEKPTGAVPRNLIIKEIVRGKGPAARPGDELTVQYVGVTFSTGDQFDSSWDSGQPLSFRLRGNEVIPGWIRGLRGMRRGGRRQLTVPPRLAYGSVGSPPGIGPNETLVFVIDLVDLRRRG